MATKQETAEERVDRPKLLEWDAVYPVDLGSVTSWGGEGPGYVAGSLPSKLG